MATFRIIRDLSEHMPADVFACVADVPNVDGSPCYFVAWGRPAGLIWSGLRPHLFGDPVEGFCGDGENGYMQFDGDAEAAAKYADEMVAAIEQTR